jgi:hypothetical protein
MHKWACVAAEITMLRNRFTLVVVIFAVGLRAAESEVRAGEPNKEKKAVTAAKILADLEDHTRKAPASWVLI